MILALVIAIDVALLAALALGIARLALRWPATAGAARSLFAIVAAILQATAAALLRAGAWATRLATPSRSGGAT